MNCTGIQFIDQHIPTFQKWIGGNLRCEKIYDSESDGDKNEVFNAKVMYKEHIVIINIDENGHFFGCYTKKPLVNDNGSNSDPDHFLFALNGEERSEPEQWKMNSIYTGGIKLMRKGEVLYEVGNHEGYLEVCKMNLKESRCILLSNVYLGLSTTDLNGTNCIRKQKFTMKRVVVLHFE